jgi:hypothetical protein
MYYTKVKNRYKPIKLAELDRLSKPGLYLIYQNGHSSTIENLTVQRVHSCKDLGLYADMVVNLKDKVVKDVLNDWEKEVSLNDIIQQVFISIINNLKTK